MVGYIIDQCGLSFLPEYVLLLYRLPFFRQRVPSEQNANNKDDISG